MRWSANQTTAIGSHTPAVTMLAIAVPSRPGRRCPTERLSRMYEPQAVAAVSANAMPSMSVVGPGLVRTTTPTPASAAQQMSLRRRESRTATVSGPRNSSVTASPSPMRSMAV